MTPTHESFNFSHVLIQGAPYDAGAAQGRALLKHPAFKSMFFPENNPRARAFSRLKSKYEQYFPSILEEVQGLADVLGVPVERAIYWFESWLDNHTGACSQFAILPAHSGYDDILCGRSYEFSPRFDDLRLSSTRVNGANAHIGFSSLLFGRTEGINDKGLCITSSSAGIPVGTLPGMRRPKTDGFHFWVIIRAILDQCQNVAEAADLIRDTPMGCNFSFILTHTNGQSMKAEVFNGKKAFSPIYGPGEVPYLVETNHLTLDHMTALEPHAMRHSLTRHQALTTRIESNRHHIDPHWCRRLLSLKYPQGPVCHFYEAAFGTLWSMMINVSKGWIDVCFGTPLCNPWHRVFLDPSKNTVDPVYPCTLPAETPDPGLFEAMAMPGG